MSDSPFTVESANRTCPLPGGRKLGFAEGGDWDGAPVFYFHGFPGSRLEATLLPASGIRLIGVDRPGYGLSTARPYRKLADWPKDIAALADHLGIKRFGVVGVSGGGPYAASVAHGLAKRVNALALICGLGPPEAPGMTFGGASGIAKALRYPGARVLMAALGRQVLMSDRALRQLRDWRMRRSPRPLADANFREGPLQQLMVANWREGLKRSSLGMAADARIYGEPWHFALRDIAVPTGIWHGRADTIVPISIGEHYAAHVPGAAAHFTDDDGHFSIVVNSLPAITDFLKARA
ncbi:MAG: alpha/beta hydrolase [Parvibaculum sp.]|uniref:alpha/beta fold hydrolase n=1 Tax=Parvibaculum sp. TaxID=2024848 RepID=UPI0025F19BE6|nr:alpha/beta hydrolase [Parvibaculum sp.]MCE9649267.1 alpha/beta hydrolase [Parvibaculum sp.]